MNVDEYLYYAENIAPHVNSGCEHTASRMVAPELTAGKIIAQVTQAFTRVC